MRGFPHSLPQCDQIANKMSAVKNLNWLTLENGRKELVMSPLRTHRHTRGKNGLEGRAISNTTDEILALRAMWKHPCVYSSCCRQRVYVVSFVVSL